jgi:regulator of sigma E protease
MTLRDQIGTHRCAGRQVDGCRAAEPTRITVIRDGREQTFPVTPVYNAELKRPLAGFVFEQKTRAVGVGEAGRLSVETMWLFTKGTVETIAGIFQADKRKDISGVVGSYEVTRQTIELSTERALFLLAVISLSLGVINLFPFLPLDGGHIFWAVAEKLRGRAIPFSVMERAGFVGFVLVIALFMIGLTNDVGRLTGEGFGVR